ncbi:hypothetical protein M9Y10_025598 [Tritrichomonas musculus]|uniref:Uncharacterized protein n=1 Tax=Tritrichomonas musculus TaxID=1915356 RepID=A0ABR2HBJ4_9EUKA
MGVFKNLLSGLTLQMQLDILDVFPFIVMLSNVWKIHSSAGISRNFVGLSCISAAIFLITSKNIKGCISSFLKFFLTLLLYFSIKFKYPLKSEKFRDTKWSLLIIPISIFLSLFTFIDDNFKTFIINIGFWLNSLSIACQVLIIKQSRRINLLYGYFPIYFICKFCYVYLLFNQAFRTTGTEMWFNWLNGVATMLLSIDLVYFAYHAKQKDDDFDLPLGQFGAFDY